MLPDRGPDERHRKGARGIMLCSRYNGPITSDTLYVLPVRGPRILDKAIQPLSLGKHFVFFVFFSH